MNAPVTVPSKAEAIHDRAWWSTECERLGTDWQSLGEVAAAVLTELALLPCPTCESTPCQTPSFCEQCREADREERTTAMPKEFDNRNRGVLFNDRANKETDKDRDYSGNINIEGVEYWLSGWIKTSKKGLKFLSLSAKAKTVDTPPTEIVVNDEIPF
jgi:hypothetical protein